MAPCHQVSCAYGYESVTNPAIGAVSGAYRSFLEVISFAIFASGLTLNSGILIVLCTAYRTLDRLDGFFMNLVLGELMATFALPFLTFFQFTNTIASVGDGGCRFLTWLDVTSVTITVTAIIAITFSLYNKLFYDDLNRLNRAKYIGCICLTWLVAGLPGLPYLAAAKMGKDNYCVISNWSHGAEISYICFMIIFQIILPLCLLVYLFVRIFLALRVSPTDENDAILNEETTPGTEANYQRALIKRHVLFVVLIAVIFYILLIISSFIALSIELNIDGILDDTGKYVRMRELVSVFQSLKCVFIPFICLFYYDKFRNQLRKICCHRNQDIYKNLRYSVYQQTVEETPRDNHMINEMSSRASQCNDEFIESERDDVAILRIETANDE